MTTRAIPRPATRSPKSKKSAPLQVSIWQNGKVKLDATPEMIPDALSDPQSVIWVDCEGNIADGVSLLKHTFQVSHITLETILEDRERAKLTEGNGYFYLVAHGLNYDGQTWEASTPKIDIVFGKNFLVTLHRAKMPWLDDLRTAARAREEKEHILSRGASVLLYGVLDALVDSYFPVLDMIDDQIDELENAAVSKANDQVQGQIFRMKRALALMRRVISPQVEVANSLVIRTGEYIPAEIEPYFADVHDHLVRAFEVIDSYRDLMSGLLDVYLSTVSNRLNDVMKQLAIISTIFLPITFVTGVFGMNFGHMPQVDHDNGSLFWYALALMGAITLIQLWIFKKRGWL